MKPKSKLHSDITNLVMTKAKAFMQSASTEMLDEDSEEEEPKQLRKATEADKERKREKMRLKRRLKREAKDRSKKKDVTVAKKEAINYLHMWNSSRDMWNFKKKLQFWLLNNIFDIKNISDENFQILLNYIIELKGEARNRLTSDCEKVIKEHEEKFADGSIDAEDLITFERARNVLQILV